MRSSDRPTMLADWWKNPPQSGNGPVTRFARVLDWLDLRCPYWQDAAEIAVGVAYLTLLVLEVWAHLG